jgi:phosphomannomutase
LGVANGRVTFFPGDLLGMISAEYLDADSVVVPISCNDAVDRGRLAGALEPKTRIGSPYVIAGMIGAAGKGRRRICGWEANGGFLAGSDIEKNGRVLKKLATRDAMLPILCVLFAAREQGTTLAELFGRLPRRFSKSALLPDFPRSLSLEIVKRFTPDSPEVREQLERIMPGDLGLGKIAQMDYTDGVRMTFGGGDVIHFRPSGNADEFRVYAVADTEERAALLAERAVAEPDGILRSLGRAGE